MDVTGVCGGWRYLMQIWWDKLNIVDLMSQPCCNLDADRLGRRRCSLNKTHIQYAEREEGGCWLCCVAALKHTCKNTTRGCFEMITSRHAQVGNV
jgi:hypothetical protein